RNFRWGRITLFGMDHPTLPIAIYLIAIALPIQIQKFFETDQFTLNRNGDDTMAKKFYAVRKGKKTGIFTSWDECKQQVHGYPGADYKGFANKEEAETYLHGSYSGKTNDSPSESEVVAYVDGSFYKETAAFSYGAVVFLKENSIAF